MAIVHFGMHKTGSSSIQQSLYRRLADPRFHYVDLGDADAGPALSIAFPRRVEEKTAAMRSRLDAELRKAGGRSAILSGERIANFGAAEFAALHAALGPEVRAAGYVRRPKEAMESILQQRIRGLGFRPREDRGFLGNLYPAYRRKLEKLDTELGRENVQLWRFEPAAFPEGCVVQDFCGRLGISFPARDVVRTNEGLSLAALSLLIAYRRFGPAREGGAQARRANGLLVQRLASLAGPKLRLHSSAAAPVLAAQRADLDWIEARLGASLAEDVSAHDEHGIRSEDDLLRCPPEAVDWLAAQLGRPAPPSLPPGEVAQWMHALSVRLLEDDRLPR